MYDTDQEQIEALQSWWKRWGNYVVLAIVLTGGLYVGNQWLDSSTAAGNQEAADAYGEVFNASQGKDAQAVAKAVAALSAEHAGEGYDFFGQLFAAKSAVEQSDFAGAKVALEQAKAMAPTEDLKDVVEVRIARIELQLGEFDNALATLEEVPSQSATAQELKGDVFLAMGDAASAKEAYEIALDSNGQYARANLVQLKLNNLAGAE